MKASEIIEETDQYGRTKFRVPDRKDADKNKNLPPKKKAPIPAHERKNLEPLNREFKPESALGKTFVVNAESIK